MKIVFLLFVLNALAAAVNFSLFANSGNILNLGVGIFNAFVALSLLVVLNKSF